MNSPAKRPFSPSPLDYTITLTRKHRYLVIGCPEFGLQVSSGFLDVSQLSPESIGSAVLQLLGQINGKLHQLDQTGERYPVPFRARKVNVLQGGQWIAAREAAQALGVSTATLRKMVKKGFVRAERTPGGHLRFSLDALSEAFQPVSLAA